MQSLLNRLRQMSRRRMVVLGIIGLILVVWLLRTLSSCLARPDLPRPINYVALGDSYTSAPLVPSVDRSDQCYRSKNNYPAQLADTLGADDFRDVSCPGAQTKDILNSQLSAVSAGTSLVTIGIGGNDEGLFSSMTSTCPQQASKNPAGAPCTEHFKAAGTGELIQVANRTGGRVQEVVTAVRAKAPQARIVLIGYPVLVPPSGTCSQLPLAAGDYPYVRSVNQQLNTAIKQAALASNAQFVDLGPASADHHLCSADPWVNGPSNDIQRAAAYHPFANEQSAVKELVVEALRKQAR